MNDFPESERPPVTVTFLAFRGMVGLGFLFALCALLAVIFVWTNSFERRRWFLWIMAIALVFPYLANELGWITAEIGRQPWIVYGLLKTADAYSRSISAGDVLGSLIAFVLIYGTLALVDAFLLAKYARKVE